MSGQAQGKLKHADCSIIVTRADGTVEDHGVVAVYDRPENIFKRIWNKIGGSK